MSVRPVEGGAGQPLSLAAIDARSHRGIVARRATKGRLVAIEGDKQDRRRPSAPPRLPGRLGRSSGWLAGRNDHRHSALGSSPAWRGSVKGRGIRSERNGLVMSNGNPRYEAVHFRRNPTISNLRGEPGRERSKSLPKKKHGILLAGLLWKGQLSSSRDSLTTC
jgi:hypothetical protein